MFSMEGKILLTGASGMVGSAVYRLLNSRLDAHLLTPSHKELNLVDQIQVDKYFYIHQPEIVLMIAAKVGGIAANNSDSVGFLSGKNDGRLPFFPKGKRFSVPIFSYKTT